MGFNMHYACCALAVDIVRFRDGIDVQKCRWLERPELEMGGNLSRFGHPFPRLRCCRRWRATIEVKARAAWSSHNLITNEDCYSLVLLQHS